MDGAPAALGGFAVELPSDGHSSISPSASRIKFTCGLSMTISVTFSVFEKISGMISTPTFTDLAVRNGDLPYLGSSAIERLSAPSEPLSSDKLKLPTSTLRPSAAEAFCLNGRPELIHWNQKWHNQRDQDENADDNGYYFQCAAHRILRRGRVWENLRAARR